MALDGLLAGGLDLVAIWYISLPSGRRLLLVLWGPGSDAVGFNALVQFFLKLPWDLNPPSLYLASFVVRFPGNADTRCFASVNQHRDCPKFR